MGTSKGLYIKKSPSGALCFSCISSTSKGGDIHRKALNFDSNAIGSVGLISDDIFTNMNG